VSEDKARRARADAIRRALDAIDKSRRAAREQQKQGSAPAQNKPARQRGYRRARFSEPNDS